MVDIPVEKLIALARAAREKAYTPYSKFKVGAALLAADGQVYTGCNVENVSYGLTICAERTAVVKAVSEGQREFKAIAVVADTEEYCSPCGACRQVLAEFGPDIKVYLVNRCGDYVTFTTAELMPRAFDKIELTGTEK
ncbi:cytidine deaminase [Desulfolucanica intricata]|uniref:cytidine deaminase n=1 Tax=Desulfolucanica intricata TaxID=1285191 RepID=UPI0008378677|nr:cytidine deaminase [Desulfolucanica intricata]